MGTIDIIKIVGVAIVTAVSSIILKATKPELAFVTCVTGGLLMLMMVVDSLKDTISLFENIANTAGIDASIIKIVLKIIGIGYIVEFGANLVEDLGFKSLSDKLVLSGKIVILLVSVPIIEGVFGVVTSLIKLI